MSKKYHIGYTCGVFDLFHIGHLNLLEKCKSMCDILIVGVCNDEYVRKVKEKEPVFPENQRLRIIRRFNRIFAIHNGNKHYTNKE